jgi:hypothetical protein
MNGIINNVITENFQNLEKGMAIQAQKGFKTPNIQDHSRTIPCHFIVKTFSIQNKEKNTEGCKEKARSYRITNLPE